VVYLILTVQASESHCVRLIIYIYDYLPLERRKKPLYVWHSVAYV